MIDFIPFIGIVELQHKQTCIVLDEEKSRQNCYTTSSYYLNSSCIRKSVTLMFMSFSKNKFTLL